MIIDIAIAIHLVASVIWVGGTFFAYVCMRPAASPLEAALRVPLWRRAMASFAPWVWVSIVALNVSGYGMVFWFFEGFANVGIHVHIMQATSILMTILFVYLYFAPWRRMKAALAGNDLPAATRELELIRHILLIILHLGLLTVLIGSTGRYWGDPYWGG